MLLFSAMLEAKHNAMRARADATAKRAGHTPQVDSSPGLPSDEVLKRVADYESRAERSLFKALHELQRLQAVRRGSVAHQ